jgi:hypothetical protein
MKTLVTSAAVLATSAMLLAPSVSFGQQRTNAFVVSRDGNPVMTRYGDCVRTRYFWTPSASHPRCKAAAPTSQGRRK